MLSQDTIPTEAARWQAVVDRDSKADGAFYYSVRTTGVFCRPSCAARLPNRENVSFFTTPAEAQAAGFRPCKRCKPTEASPSERYAKLIAQACRTIEAAETPPSLSALAQGAGLSQHHFHRVFKAVAGVTPRAYASAERSRRVREGLVKSGSVTEAIYDAGFNSGGRFYEQAAGVLGMTPTRFRKGGERTTIHFAVGECSLGAILVATTDKGVCAILLGDDPADLARDLQDRFPHAELVGADPGFEGLVAQVVGLIEHPGLAADLPLDIQGTAFQQRVWEALRKIRAGETASYAKIAERIGAPTAVRAVAQACAANRLAVAIPCHRVVRTDGALSGYAWGVERKRALLERERAA
ncbi:MAG TPA: bifunctional DNA-binding transcriptional regulator/O6-methylguanine-DNA methyltransferase Ada [Caulobacteraceae bacterium]|nr:bifunctional DNA-binding transcriptional regulator/O6-methylguanine-DNA methyltransferase Ada [Caulobacteraceae bacterium]